MKWRLLLDGAREGAENMAVDEALFRSASTRGCPPTLRLYTWRRPCLSIGYGQVFEQVCDAEACRRLGIDVVRRITGGRAVLHHRELTYSVSSSLDGVLRALSVRQVYNWVSQGLRAALESLDVELDPPSFRSASSPGTTEAPELPCMAVPTGHEITAGGRKLVGSAQKRGRRAFLQHGSILLAVDPPLWRRATGLPAPTDLGAVGLGELSRHGLNEARLEGALRKAFQDLFGEPPTETKLSSEERKTARTLALGKYASEKWNVHRRPAVDKVSKIGVRAG